MELRSTGNTDINNPVTMSMLEYLASKGCEVMATRNILHVSKLQEFEDFLESKGYMIVATSKNPYEALRAQKYGDTVVVYKKKDAKEHLSTLDKDYHLVREFIKGQRKQINADRIRSMTDEELAEYLTTFQNAFGEGYEGMMSCLDWLKQPAEE